MIRSAIFKLTRTQYYLIVATTFFTTSAWFRLFGTLCRNYDQANRYVSAIVTFFELYSGYLIPVRCPARYLVRSDSHFAAQIYAQKRWLFWISYLSPFQYGYAAALANEVRRHRSPLSSLRSRSSDSPSLSISSNAWISPATATTSFQTRSTANYRSTQRHLATIRSAPSRARLLDRTSFPAVTTSLLRMATKSASRYVRVHLGQVHRERG